MSLEGYIPSEGISENGVSGSEKVSEVSEKFKESVRKASSGISRTKKDEKKAKKQDLLLARFLVEIILNKKYDNVLKYLFDLIDLGVPSNFLLGVMSLIYIDISNELRKEFGKKQIDFEYSIKEIMSFDDSNLDSNIRDRINYWIEDIIDSVTIEYSSIMNKRLIKLLEKEGKIIHFVSFVFAFFLKDLKINITESKSKGIAEFIVMELIKNLKKLKLEEV